MSTYKRIWFVLLAGLMLSLPTGNASAASIELRPQGSTTFGIGETLDIDVYVLLDAADQVATIDAVTMQLTGGGGLVTVMADTTGSAFPHPPSVVNTATVFPAPPDFIAFAQFGGLVSGAEGFLARLTLTGAVEGSYDLVALRSAPGQPPLITAPGSAANRYDLSSDESLTITVGTAVIPEPGTLVLLGASLAGLAFLRRRVA